MPRRYRASPAIRPAGCRRLDTCPRCPSCSIAPWWHGMWVPIMQIVVDVTDRAVLAWDVVYGGGGDDHTLLRIAPAELARVTVAEWVDL